MTYSGWYAMKQKQTKLNGVKQCTTCQRTNYHNTTNHSRYLSRLELLQSRDINDAHLHVPKYSKTFKLKIK